ncbi:hypothetical protein [Adlercreutzia sp. ZJ305]|uniref:hypothetical protein n=2 Tax=unclassified Adlercreutzia TaxID=2636013 RepID=UPI0013EAD46B|nr:hypothetical protein [Adlercreutzia sp. ZJ305]
MRNETIASKSLYLKQDTEEKHMNGLDIMVSQLTSVGAPGGIPVDTSNPWLMFLGGLLLLLICAGGGAASKKSSSGNNKKYKPDEVERSADGDTVRYKLKATGEVLFEGTRIDALKWKRENVETISKFKEK